MVTTELTLPIIVGGALVDSIAPCVIGVMILLMVVLSRVKNKRLLLKAGLLYIAGVYTTYLLAGVTLLKVFEISRDIVFFANYFYIGIGALVIAFGLLELKDLFWYGRWLSLSIPARTVAYVERYVLKTVNVPLLAFLFGVFVVMVELPCTGAPYLAVLALMSFFPFEVALPYLLLYNLIFVLPILAILLMVYKGTAIKKVENWRRKHRRWARFLLGAFLVGLGVLLVGIVAPHLVPVFAAASVLIIAAMFALWKLGY